MSSTVGCQPDTDVAVPLQAEACAGWQAFKEPPGGKSSPDAWREPSAHAAADQKQQHVVGTVLGASRCDFGQPPNAYKSEGAVIVPPEGSQEESKVAMGR